MLSQSQLNRPHPIVKTISADTFSQAKLALVERHYHAQASLECARAAHGDEHQYTVFWKGEIGRMEEALAELECGGVVA